jgi:hypothetical protein
MTTPGAATAAQLRRAIVETLYPISAYELEEACVALGLAPAGENESPFENKRRYVSRRLVGLALPGLVDLGRKVEEYHENEALSQLLGSTGASGVDGELKNLIFAANGPKPRIVLRDAINNVVEIVENAQYCLVYDRPLSPHGLTWVDLTVWWAKREGTDPDDATTPKDLYRRLRESLSSESPPELVLFEAYASRYRREFGGVMPALIPQVYLHYDPYTMRELAARDGSSALVRQRMDFLLLLPNKARVVIEVDGKQHYATGDRASPALYAEMVREDRRLRLAGYEVYRFGAAELMAEDGAAAADSFFTALLQRHGIGTQ